MASLTQWTWVWGNLGELWKVGKLGVLQSIGSQRIGHNWVTNTFTYYRGHLLYSESTDLDVNLIQKHLQRTLEYCLNKYLGTEAYPSWHIQLNITHWGGLDISGLPWGLPGRIGQSLPSQRHWAEQVSGHWTVASALLTKSCALNQDCIY